MVEAVEAVLEQASKAAAASGAEVESNAAVQNVENELDDLTVAEIEAPSATDVNDFESVINKIEAIELTEIEQADPSSLNFALGQLLNEDKATKSRPWEMWDTIVSDMGASSVESVGDMQNATPENMVEKMSESMDKSLQFQHEMHQQFIAHGVQMEKSAWIRSIATSLVKGVRKLVTQT